MKQTQTGKRRHRNATTTPEMRRFIQESALNVSQLARLLNISEATVRKWRKRESTQDQSHTPHHLNTTLSDIQEYVVVGLRWQLKLPLDRLLQVTQEFINPHVSRSGLARCLKRHGASRLDNIDAAHSLPPKHFNKLPVYSGSKMQTYTLNSQTLADALMLPSTDEHTVVQVEAMSIPIGQQTHSVLIGMDPVSGWVYVDIYQDDDTHAADRYIAYVLKRAPFALRRLLVRNYHIFQSRFPAAAKAGRKPRPQLAATNGDAQ
ncbi:helix-turn-helix domain-containing protein [Shewanella algae]|uniref:helix-turn-helix domain-containing protein n=1 Tax=Shewanella algae TaxID=38313 RepID=UPI000B8AFDE8|nr:helix-turn-helix domain-containing protein [Shewanella algae]MBO2629588.1 helix-turn-helix domain-containing protein [Shewanella algae]MBO2659184.1 helix-turn-helix domain-containing protein [Shewanella algae]OXS01150.1 transcriptional regulator [Shewanella algae]PWF92647.1 helix-turn-helix domain-containing protein [Shewanella algae]QHD54311.1 helix-turn-helix domain-containing protein [Shewanella algae]